MAETETLNLIQKLAKIRAISDVVAKEKRGYNYGDLWNRSRTSNNNR